MTDIVERLRWWCSNKPPKVMDTLRDDCRDAADEIERLRAENNRLHEQIEGLNELLVRVQEQPA